MRMWVKNKLFAIYFHVRTYAFAYMKISDSTFDKYVQHERVFLYMWYLCCQLHTMHCHLQAAGDTNCLETDSFLSFSFLGNFWPPRAQFDEITEKTEKQLNCLPAGVSRNPGNLETSGKTNVKYEIFPIGILEDI